MVPLVYSQLDWKGIEQTYELLITGCFCVERGSSCIISARLESHWRNLKLDWSLDVFVRKGVLSRGLQKEDSISVLLWMSFFLLWPRRFLVVRKKSSRYIGDRNTKVGPFSWAYIKNESNVNIVKFDNRYLQMWKTKLNEFEFSRW